jgi:hypothetical protein
MPDAGFLLHTQCLLLLGLVRVARLRFSADLLDKGRQLMRRVVRPDGGTIHMHATHRASSDRIVDVTVDTVADQVGHDGRFDLRAVNCALSTVSDSAERTNGTRRHALNVRLQHVRFGFVSYRTAEVSAGRICCGVGHHDLTERRRLLMDVTKTSVGVFDDGLVLRPCHWAVVSVLVNEGHAHWVRAEAVEVADNRRAGAEAEGDHAEKGDRDLLDHWISPLLQFEG